MPAERVKSKAMYLPALEEPQPARFEKRNATSLSEYWIEIIGYGDRYLGLAFRNQPKYFALFTIAMLAALLQSHP